MAVEDQPTTDNISATQTKRKGGRRKAAEVVICTSQQDGAVSHQAIRAKYVCEGGAIYLHMCPPGTVDVYGAITIKEAAERMHCSERTVRRQLAAYEAG